MFWHCDELPLAQDKIPSSSTRLGVFGREEMRYSASTILVRSLLMVVACNPKVILFVGLFYSCGEWHPRFFEGFEC